MKKIKAMLALLLTCCILMTATGCLVQINEEKNNNIVLAVIDGKHEVLKKDYLPIFNYYVAMYEYYGMEITDEVREQCIDTIIREKIFTLEMDDAEFAVNEDDLKKAREDYEKELQELADSYKEEAEAEAAEKEDESEDDAEGDAEGDTEGDTEGDAEDKEEERDYLQEAKDYYAKSFEESGMTEEEYIDELAETHRLERYKDYLMSDIVATDEEVKERYKELKDSQTSKPDTDAEILIYEPSGVNYKYITISLTEEEMDEYEKMVKDAGEDEEKLEKAEEYLEEAAKKRAEEYIAKLDKGEKFETLMEEANKFLKDNCGVSEDDLVKVDEELKLYKGDSTGIKGELDAKLLSLSTGSNTAALYTENGTYVIAKCYGRFASKTNELGEADSDLYKAIMEALVEEKKEEKWTTLSEDIVKKHTIKKYENRYHGKFY